MTSTPGRKAPSKTSGRDTQPTSSVDLSSPDASNSPELPNDRDETSGMTGGVQNGTVQQGERDVKRGVKDTSRAPEADDAYRKLKK